MPPPASMGNCHQACGGREWGSHPRCAGCPMSLWSAPSFLPGWIAYSFLVATVQTNHPQNQKSGKPNSQAVREFSFLKLQGFVRIWNDPMDFPGWLLQLCSIQCPHPSVMPRFCATWEQSPPPAFPQPPRGVTFTGEVRKRWWRER